jgi:hypothetical protein
MPRLNKVFRIVQIHVLSAAYDSSSLGMFFGLQRP